MLSLHQSAKSGVHVPLSSCAGPSVDGSNYDWAIVSGGPPKTNTGAGCVAGPVNPTVFDVNGAGGHKARADSAGQWPGRLGSSSVKIMSAMSIETSGHPKTCLAYG